ncbi:MAG: hypothetical protein P0Y66_21940 [Candidatus Kaistia colombiensis]|nr:MAG: hypothetical protein P0Y66_21940 [Kaistia sp.]
MKPPARPLTLTKTEAALRQISAAIEAFAVGDFDIAVTLAGAAEGAIIDPPPTSQVVLIKNLPAGIERAGGKKEWNRSINQTRDWLKHVTTDLPNAIVVQRSDAAFQIARALIKLQAVHTWDDLRMEEFRVWITEYIDRLDEPAA